MNLGNFKALLGENHIWPAEYLFKFIVRSDKVEEVTELLNTKPENITLIPSRQGKYTSVSANLVMHSSNEVIAIYEKAKTIEGIVSL